LFPGDNFARVPAYIATPVRTGQTDSDVESGRSFWITREILLLGLRMTAFGMGNGCFRARGRSKRRPYEVVADARAPLSFVEDRGADI